MTDEKIGDLLEGFANYYWSVPLKYVTDKIMEWHLDVTLKQINKVIKKCNDNLYWPHCYVETAAFDEPELVVEHLVVLDEKDLKQFIAARWDLPYADCDEKALFDKKDMRYDLPEADAIIEFARTELGVGLDFAKQLIHECWLNQPYALSNGESWVMSVLMTERFGRIEFKTVSQVERFRTLGTVLYQRLPNPVFRGWRPIDVENPPKLPDEISHRDKDIPNDRKQIEMLMNLFDGREKGKETVMKGIGLSESDLANEIKEEPKITSGMEIDRNKPCPCGSGKKYKTGQGIDTLVNGNLLKD